MSEWDQSTIKQIARIQYDLRDTSLDSVARQIRQEMFSKGEASDLIDLIDREEYDYADRIIRAKLGSSQRSPAVKEATKRSA